MIFTLAKTKDYIPPMYLNEAEPVVFTLKCMTSKEAVEYIEGEEKSNEAILKKGVISIRGAYAEDGTLIDTVDKFLELSGQFQAVNEVAKEILKLGGLLVETKNA